MSKETKRPEVWEVTLPKTRCEWAKVIRPEDRIGDTVLKKDEQRYNIDLIFDEDAISKYTEKVENMISEMESATISEIKEKGLPKGKEKKKLADLEVQDSPFKTVYDDETGEETGELKLRPNKKAYYINKDKDIERKLSVPIFDSKGNPFPEGKEIGNGSIVKARVKFNPYTFGTKLGVSAKLVALMVVELREYGAGSFTFDENEFEDGYVADEESYEASPITNTDEDEDF